MTAEFLHSAAAHYYAYGLIGEYQLHWSEDGSGAIWSFEVYPQHQGQGHAKAMMAELLARHGDKRLTLIVKQGNAIAIALYRKFNFEIVSIDDLRDEFLMMRRAA